GHAVEGVVDLDGGEARGVEGEHLRLLHLLGIEAPLPFLVAVAARSREDVHGAGAKASTRRLPPRRVWERMAGRLFTAPLESSMTSNVPARAALASLAALFAASSLAAAPPAAAPSPRAPRAYTIEQFMGTTSVNGASFSADESRILY